MLTVCVLILFTICLPLGVTENVDGENMKRVYSDREGMPSLVRGIGFTVDSCIAAEDDESKVVTITGLLYSLIERVGTKSEGPEYYLRMDDGAEIHVFKKANLWQEDPALQEHTNKRVSVSGDLYEKELYYKEVKPIVE